MFSWSQNNLISAYRRSISTLLSGGISKNDLTSSFLEHDGIDAWINAISVLDNMSGLLWSTFVDAKTFCYMAGNSPVFLTPVHSPDLFFTDLFIWRLWSYFRRIWHTWCWFEKKIQDIYPSSTLLKLFSLYFGVMAVYLNFRAGVEKHNETGEADTSIKVMILFFL